MNTEREPPTPDEPTPPPGPNDNTERPYWERPQGSNGRFQRNPATAARDAAAADLRSAGRTYQQIADELGYCDKKEAWEGVRRAVRDVIKGPAERLISLHLERLETLYEAALEVLEADHVVVSHGQIVRGDDGQPLKDTGPKLAAIREARSTLDSFWTLTGMKKPAKVEHSGGVTYEIIGVSPEELT